MDYASVSLALLLIVLSLLFSFFALFSSRFLFLKNSEKL